MDTHLAVDLGVLTILSGQTESTSMSFRGWRGASQSVSIIGPGTLTGTVKVQTSEDGIVWRDKQSAGSDITIAADGDVTIKAVNWKYLRVVSSAAEGGNREFIVKGEEGR